MDRREFMRSLCAGGALATCGAAGGLAVAQSWRAGPSPSISPKRLALAVDLAACNRNIGCTACIDACHAAHNVPSIPERSKEVKWIWKQPFEHTFPTEVHEAMSAERRAQPALVLCNHCENPPCVRVCPTGATWRRPDGIVMMDEHRCIGCRYCMVACPYGARSFNWQDPRPRLDRVNPSYPTRTVGVVEKCTLCADRVSQGLSPICVRVCRASATGALHFGDLDDPVSPLVRLLETRTVLRRKPSLSTSPHVFYLI